MLVLVICHHGALHCRTLGWGKFYFNCNDHMDTICCWHILMVDCAALVCQPPVRVRFSEVRLKKRLFTNAVDPGKLMILGGYNINLSIQSHGWNFCGWGASWTLLNHITELIIKHKTGPWNFFLGQRAMHVYNCNA